MKEYKAAVFIGRFQPFHNGHLEVLKHGLEIAENVVIIIGSDRAAVDIRNPWTFDERKSMIESVLDQKELGRIHIHGVRDYYGSDNFWIRDVQNKVSQHADEGDSVAILGTYKDASSSYLRCFPQWEFVNTKTEMMDATTARKELFSNGTMPDIIPDPIRKWILWEWAFNKPGGWTPGPEGSLSYTAVMSRLALEFKFNEDYKERHSFRDEKIPYRPIFVTVDTAVVCSGHVLVVKRKFNPGMGLLALPGGFVKENEKLQDAAIRELKEETGIRVDKLILENAIVDSHAFDDPKRSLRGRTITHVFYVRLKDGELPAVRGGDDADKAFWMPLMDVVAKEPEFFEDHCHIINYFINRGR